MRDKTYRFLGIPLYQKKTKGSVVKKKVLGLTILRHEEKIDKIKSYFFGVCYRRKRVEIPYKVWPPEISKQEFVALKNTQPRELLIVAADHICDYILMRNILGEIKKTARFEGYRFTLLGSKGYKAYAEYLDKGVIDHFIWVEENIQKANIYKLEQTRRLLHEKQGMKRYYDTILYASCNSLSPGLLKTYDHLMSGVISRERVAYAHKPGMENAPRLLHFTRIITNYKSRQQFEYERVKFLFQALTGENIQTPHAFIEHEKVAVADAEEGEYIIINPCAGQVQNQWHRNNWIQLILSLNQTQKRKIVLYGSKSNNKIITGLRNELQFYGVLCEARVGISVPELLKLMKNASLYIGLENSLFHVAVALGQNTICLSPGATYYRWLSGYMTRHNVRIVFPLGWLDWFSNKSQDPSWTYPEDIYVVSGIRVKDVLDAAMGF